MYTYIQLNTDEKYSEEYLNNWIDSSDNADFIYSELINCIRWMIDNHNYKYNNYFSLNFTDNEIVFSVSIKEASDKLRDAIGFYINLERYEKCYEISNLIDDAENIARLIKYNEDIINGDTPNCWKIF